MNEQTGQVSSLGIPWKHKEKEMAGEHKICKSKRCIAFKWHI